MNRPEKVFLVDDEQPVLRALSRLLRSQGYTIEAFGSGREFMARYKPSMFGCLVMDISMPEVTGLDVQEWLSGSLPIIFLTGKDDVHERARALERGAVDVLMKPVVASALFKGIEDALARNRGY
jgi:FixJ family two-component response regulator